MADVSVWAFIISYWQKIGGYNFIFYPMYSCFPTYNHVYWIQIHPFWKNIALLRLHKKAWIIVVPNMCAVLHYSTSPLKLWQGRDTVVLKNVMYMVLTYIQKCTVKIENMLYVPTKIKMVLCSRVVFFPSWNALPLPLILILTVCCV